MESNVPEELRSSLATLMESAKGPQPSDVYAAQTWEMAGAHACIINGLLDVYQVSRFSKYTWSMEEY